MGIRIEISSTVPRVDPRDHQQAPKRPQRGHKEAQQWPSKGPQEARKGFKLASKRRPRSMPRDPDPYRGPRAPEEAPGGVFEGVLMISLLVRRPSEAPRQPPRAS